MTSLTFGDVTPFAVQSRKKEWDNGHDNYCLETGLSQSCFKAILNLLGLLYLISAEKNFDRGSMLYEALSSFVKVGLFKYVLNMSE